MYMFIDLISLPSIYTIYILYTCVYCITSSVNTVLVRHVKYLVGLFSFLFIQKIKWKNIQNVLIAISLQTFGKMMTLRLEQFD